MRNRILIYSGRFFFSLSLAGLVMYAIDGAWGTIIAAVIMFLTCIAFHIDRKRVPEEGETLNMPLLLDVLLILVPVGVIVFKSDVLCYQLEILFGAMAAAGLLDIISWFCIKSYAGMSFRQLFRREFRLDPIIDVVALAVFVIWCIKDHAVPDTFQTFIPIFLIADYIHQKVDNPSTFGNRLDR